MTTTRTPANSKNKNAMAGFATEQNATLLIPAIAFGITDFFLFITPEAESKGWATGFIAVLEERKIHVMKIQLGVEEAEIPSNLKKKIKENLNRYLKNFNQFYLNLGGGKKIQSILLYEFAQETSGQSKGKPQISMCYVNQDTETIECWKKEEGWIPSSKKFATDIKTAELLALANLTINESAPLSSDQSKYINNIWQKDDQYKPLREQIYFETKLPQEERGYSTEKVEVLKELFQQVKLNTNDFKFSSKKHTVPAVLLKDDKDCRNILGRYFEQCTFQELRNLIKNIEQKKTELKKYKHILTNVKVKRKGKEERFGEYDVLIHTSSDTLIALEMKTLDFGNKELESFVHRARITGGSYIKVVVVFPYFTSDLKTEKSLMPIETQKLPVFLANIGIPFFVLTNKTDPFAVKKITEDKVEEVKIIKDAFVDGSCNVLKTDHALCTPFEQLFEVLKLIEK